MAKKAKKSSHCVIEDCRKPATTLSYCRYHYIANWKPIKFREKLLAEKKMDRYVREVVKRHPHEYREIIKRDMAGDKELDALLREMEISDSDYAEEIDEILKYIKTE